MQFTTNDQSSHEYDMYILGMTMILSQWSDISNEMQILKIKSVGANKICRLILNLHSEMVHRTN